MYTKKSAKPAVITITILCAAVLSVCFLYSNNLTGQIEIYKSAQAGTLELYQTYQPSPFINSAADARPYTPALGHADALYYFPAPEGFEIISHSRHWNYDMLELLYHELKMNTHGKEIEQLREVIIFPDDDTNINALATYSPGITTVDFVIRFPAFPIDFSVGFPIYTGRINLFGGETNTTIESIAGSLSHEYGHHYTFYYMFDEQTRKGGLLEDSKYGILRDAGEHNLIGSLDMDEDYLSQRHRYIIETSAEDYVVLMGSPTSRQVRDYYDVKQLVDNPGLPGIRTGERNAFPQENMAMPLANDVPGLEEYFYSFIDAEPRVPLEDKQDILININKHSETHDLATGKRTYEYYTITWNTPYPDAIYTIACFEPEDYHGWGYPIKTIHPGSYSAGSASAIVGEYAAVRGNTVYSMDDGLATGVKTFYVVAQLPGGAYYLSELYEVNFG